MPDVTQSRALPETSHPWSLYKGNGQAAPVLTGQGNAPWFPGNQTTSSYRSRSGENQETEDDRMSGEDMRKGLKHLRARYRTRYDNGHEFFTEKRTRTLTTPLATLTRQPTVYPGCNTPVGHPVARLTAHLMPFAGALHGWPDVSSVAPDAAAMRADGRRAIQATIPTSPEAGLAQMLAELKERLPQIPATVLGRKGFNSRNIGSEHLNVEFGIRPLIKDVENLAQSVLKASQLLAQFRRDSGKPVRRAMHLSDESFTIDRGKVGNQVRFACTSSDPVMDTFYSSAGSTSVVDLINRRAWFKGAYTYYLSEAHDFLGRAQRYEQLANHLLGTRIDASLVYELTPWSWLFDWFGDFGTFLSNVSMLSADSLVLRYGYVMHTTVATRMLHSTGYVPRSPDCWTTTTKTFGAPTFATENLEVVRKTRTRSTPYGFGLDPDAFSVRQWAILGALGMTKGPKTLR